MKSKKKDIDIHTKMAKKIIKLNDDIKKIKRGTRSNDRWTWIKHKIRRIGRKDKDQRKRIEETGIRIKKT